MSVATYTLGAPARPNIHHDNGFLDRFKKRAPTAGDYVRLARWEVTLEAAEAAQGVPLAPHNNIPDALAAYRHFLHGHGRTRTFAYNRYVTNDPSGVLTLANAILDAKDGAQTVYAASLAGRSPAHFQMTGTAIPAGGGDVRFPYPQTENWQKAIGAHNFWISADVDVASSGGAAQFTMVMTIHVEDMYNFNPGAADIATGIPDSDNGVFEVTGLAEQYLNVSTITRTVTWTGTAAGVPAVGGAPDGRQRQPDDNRRVRNRL